jgi:hypothetical protein
LSPRTSDDNALFPIELTVITRRAKRKYQPGLLYKPVPLTMRRRSHYVRLQNGDVTNQSGCVVEAPVGRSIARRDLTVARQHPVAAVKSRRDARNGARHKAGFALTGRTGGVEGGAGWTGGAESVDPFSEVRDLERRDRRAHKPVAGVTVSVDADAVAWLVTVLGPHQLQLRSAEHM